MAEITDRHRQLAAELDLAIVEEETGETDIEAMSVRVQALIAEKLAAFQAELAKDRNFILKAAQEMLADHLPRRLPHCECVLFLPASMRCSGAWARCNSRMGHFAEKIQAREEKDRAKANAATSGQKTKGLEP